MSEHDEPKAALTRLVVDTLAALGSPHEVARQVTRQHDGMHANSSVCIGCGETFPVDGPSWPDAARGHDRHQWQAIAARLADVLLADGYMRRPAGLVPLKFGPNECEYCGCAVEDGRCLWCDSQDSDASYGSS